MSGRVTEGIVGASDRREDGPVGSGQQARAYHQATKHSWESVRRGGRALDWENRPCPFKAYRGVEKIDLPRDLPGLEVGAMDALAGSAGRGEKVAPRPPSMEDLSRLLRLGAGAHRRVRFPDGEVVHFRTHASAGALYPNEAYLVCGDLPGLPEGVYHYDPLAHALDRLRPGDHRGHLVRACAGEPAVAGAPATPLVTGVPRRTGGKYGDRGYRPLGLGAGVVLGFAEGEIEALLGLDPRREFPLCLVPVGEGQPVRAGPQPPEAVAFEEEPASAREDRFPAIREGNDAGRLTDPRAAARWRGADLGAAGQAWPQPVVVEPAPPPSDPLDRVILRRGSARDFGPGSMPAGVLAAILSAATGRVPTDLVPTGGRLTRVFLVANAVPGLPPGALAYQDNRFHLLRAGEFRRKAAFMCLEQRLAADAAVACFLLSDLDLLLPTGGDRGDRMGQPEAGIVAGRLYLGAYAF